MDDLSVNCLPRDQTTNRVNETNLEGSLVSTPNTDTPEAIDAGLKLLNRYCRDQGITDSDVIYWDGQVREMMETVRKMREAVPLRAKVDNVFSFPYEEDKDGKMPLTDKNLTASLAEIERMDNVLKEKEVEEKKAKLSTIQSEEESRDLLTKMPFSEASTGMRANFAEFMKLLSDFDNTESDYPTLPPLDGIELKEQEEQKEPEEPNGTKEQKEPEEDTINVEERKGTPESQQQKPSNAKFIERNIKLAKCGRGTLSITEEEKTRLENILEDLMENVTKNEEELKEPETKQDEDSVNVPEEEQFGMDCEIKSILSQIDQQLEVLRNQRCCPSQSTVSVLEKDKSEDEDDKQNQNRRRKREKTPDRLEKINQRLSQINSVSKEEVKPLSEKEMANLVQQSMRSLNEWKKSGAEEIRQLEEAGWPDLKPPESVIAELVSDAKTLMPKFKYRFGKA